MAAKNRSVFGIYAAADQAERAVNTLIEDGFMSQDVSVLMPDQRSTREFAHHKDTKAPEGVTAGASAGGVVGGTLGVLIGLGTLAIPGAGPFLAAGPIVAGLAGLGAGGAVGGLIGALVGMGIPEYEARRYEGRVKDGGILLSVHCETPGEILRAREILTGTGAADIAASAESVSASPSAASAPRPSTDARAQNTASGPK
ncbi:MAG: general stress protein [Steroidobacteraceae bacterium]